MCVQNGNVVPAPTTNGVPHAFAPRAQSAWDRASSAYREVPKSSSNASPALTSPNACGTGSHG